MKPMVTIIVAVMAAHVSAQSYPQHSLRLDEEGDVTLAYKVGEQGVFDCQVLRSSGFPRLDAASCPLLIASMEGIAETVLVDRQKTIQWKLPPNETTETEERSGKFPVRIADVSRSVNIVDAGELPSGRRENLGLYITVGANGSVEACSVRWRSENPNLDRRACEIARNWRYKPVLKNGTAVKSRIPETFYWAASDAALPTDK